MPLEIGALRLIELHAGFNNLTELPSGRYPALSTLTLKGNLMHSSLERDILEDRWGVRKLLDTMERSDPRPLVQDIVRLILLAWRFGGAETPFHQMPRDLVRIILDDVWFSRYDRGLWINARLETTKKCVIC